MRGHIEAIALTDTLLKILDPFTETAAEFRELPAAKDDKDDHEN